MALEESAQKHTQRTGLVWCYFAKGGIGGELGWCGAGPRLGTVEIWASMKAVLQCVTDAQLMSAYDAMPQETTDPTQRPSC